MKRVLVLGNSGAGKTTLCFALHQHLNLPLHHLDVYYFRPNWEMLDDPTWEKKLRSLVAQEAWILDGQCNFLELRVEKADTLIYIDTPRWRCLLRVFKRMFVNLTRDRPDKPKGCPERISWDLLTHLWSWPQKRDWVLSILSREQHRKSVYFLKNDQDIANFKDRLPKPRDLEPYLIHNSLPQFETNTTDDS